MRPIDRRAEPADYATARPATLALTTTQALRNDALQVFNTDTPSLSDCIAAWTDEVRQGPSGGARTRVVDVIRRRIGGIYTKAGPLLGQEFGAFCCFCDSPIPGQMDVEHAVPKSEYPDWALDWENFLLACSACNGLKGPRPGRAAILSELQRLGNPSPAETDFRDHIRQTFCWPDQPHMPSYDDLRPRLHADLGAGFQPVSGPDAVDSGIAIVRQDLHPRQRTLANVTVNGQWYYGCEVAVLVDPTSTPAQDMVDLCKLNRYTGLPISDRRVLNRTQAWFTAVQSAHSLLSPSTPNWSTLLTLAGATGHFSVWVQVLEHVSSAYARSFVMAANWAGYPHTDTARLP
jgi:hypothetical protein